MKFAYLAERKNAIGVVAKWYFNQWGYLTDASSIEKTIQTLQDYLHHDKIPLIILAVKKDQILGAIQLKYYEMDFDPKKEHWLGGVYVSEQHRGHKVAEKLVLQAIEVAKLHHVQKLYLQTERMDGGLYKRLGWKAIEKGFYKKKSVLVMKKEL